MTTCICDLTLDSDNSIVSATMYEAQTRSAPRKIVIAGCTSAAVAAAGLVIAVWAVSRHIDSSASPRLYTDVASLPHRNVGLVLGTSRWSSDGVQNEFYTARMDAAAAAFHGSKIDHIIVSGSNPSPYYNEPDAMKKDLIARLVPEGFITEDKAGLRTLDSVVRADKVMGQKSFTVISQRSHAARAVYLGLHFGLDVVAYCAKDPSGRVAYGPELREYGARFKALGETELLDAAARALTADKALGWFQGRMEFGPRALGARSILANPMSATMQKTLNLKVKYRESFRPFAPAVRREDVGEWFEMEGDSPYMLLVANVAERRRRRMSAAEDALFGIDKLNVVRSEIPAVTHVDYSARIQTVEAGSNPRFHALLTRFKALIGCPVVVNTSFNVRGEPIVCTPEDAFRCFMGTGIDVLAIGNCLLEKEDQDPSLKRDYAGDFELD